MCKKIFNIFLTFSFFLIFTHDLSASEYYWKYAKGQGSEYYWKYAKGQGSEYYWKYAKGQGSEYYWKYAKGSSYPEEPMTNVCLGILEDGDEIPYICEIYPIIKYKLDE